MGEKDFYGLNADEQLGFKEVLVVIENWISYMVIEL